MQTFTRWTDSTKEEESYCTCEDCSPHSDDEEELETLVDTYGGCSCEICGKEYDHETKKYTTYEEN